MQAHRTTLHDTAETEGTPRLTRKTFTVPEAAALLGISRAKAYRCVRSGELHALQFGRRIVVPARVLEDLLGTTPVSAGRHTA